MEAYNKVIESKSVDADYDIIKKAMRYGFIAKKKNDKKLKS
jgi:hypothetical protein